MKIKIHPNASTNRNVLEISQEPMFGNLAYVARRVDDGHAVAYRYDLGELIRLIDAWKRATRGWGKVL